MSGETWYLLALYISWGGEQRQDLLATLEVFINAILKQLHMTDGSVQNANTEPLILPLNSDTEQT